MMETGAGRSAEGAGVECLDFVAPLPDQEFRDALAAVDVVLVNEKPGVGKWPFRAN
jgi:hypothetical protein